MKKLVNSWSVVELDEETLTVTVTNPRTGFVRFNGQRLTLKEALEMYHRKIRDTLGYDPDVLASYNNGYRPWIAH